MKLPRTDEGLAGERDAGDATGSRRVPRPAMARRRRRRGRSEAAPRPVRVLVADDDSFMLSALETALVAWGYLVTTADTGRAAWEALDGPSPPDLALLDRDMPELDGLEICRRLSRREHETPPYVIIVTASGGVDAVTEGLGAGADDYITKPFQFPEIKSRIEVGARTVALRHALASRVRDLEASLERERQIETALRESDEYRKLFELADDPILVHEHEHGTVLAVNAKACDAYALAPSRVIGRPVEEFIPGVWRAGRGALATGTKPLEVTYRRPDGTYLILAVNSVEVNYRGLPAVLSFARDVTDQALSELKVQQAQSEWRGTVDAMVDLVFVTDGEGKVLRCNNASAAFFGRAFPEIIGQTMHDLFGVVPGDVDPFTGPGRQTRFRLSDRWFEVVNHSLPSTARSPGLVHILKDVTRRRATEEARRLLATAVDQAADSVAIMDTRGVIEYVNPAFEQATGWSRDEATARQFYELKQISSEVVDDIECTVGDERVWTGSYRARRRDGFLYDEEASIAPVRDVGGAVTNFVSVSRNVSEQRRLEAIAASVNMMENIGYVFAGVRHELGNPINAIKTALTVLSRHYADWELETIRDFIARALNEIGRVEYLLKALKSFGEHEAPRARPVSFSSFMESFLPLARESLSLRGVRIETSFDDEAGDLLADPRALHQILLNLFSNAADALDGRPDPAIRIGVARRGSVTEVTIRDNGAGMNADQQQALFKPFHTSKAHGTGLGLVIVKNMMTKMDGTIAIESRAGVGTDVMLSFRAITAGRTPDGS